MDVHNKPPRPPPTHTHTLMNAKCRVKKRQRENVWTTVISLQANCQSPVKLPKLFPNANRVYQINKETKDAHEEIWVFLFSSCWWKNETFPSRFLFRFSTTEQDTDWYVWRFCFESFFLIHGTSSTLLRQRDPSKQTISLNWALFILVTAGPVLWIECGWKPWEPEWRIHPCITKALFFSIMEVVNVLVYKWQPFTTNSQ